MNKLLVVHKTAVHSRDLLRFQNYTFTKSITHLPCSFTVYAHLGDTSLLTPRNADFAVNRYNHHWEKMAL